MRKIHLSETLKYPEERGSQWQTLTDLLFHGGERWLFLPEGRTALSLSLIFPKYLFLFLSRLSVQPSILIVRYFGQNIDTNNLLPLLPPVTQQYKQYQAGWMEEKGKEVYYNHLSCLQSPVFRLANCIF